LLFHLLFIFLQTGKLEGMPGRTLMEAFEQKVNAVLNKARDDAGEAGG
jgi:DNA-directed RNA polymerase II subunit RPB1